MTDALLSVSIEPIWGTIRDIRGKVGVLLMEHPLELRSAVMMAASELLENAVKYGDIVARAQRILFSLSLADGTIRIQTVNGSSDDQNVQRLRARVHRLRTTEDPKALYFSAIQEMIVCPMEDGGGGLGLYRIAAEGGFSLSCDYEDGAVRVLATRSIA